MAGPNLQPEESLGHKISGGSSSEGRSCLDLEDDETGSENFTLGKRGILVFLTLGVLTLMAALDGTSISVALPIISKDLNGSAIEAFWSGTAFLLCSTVFQPNFTSFSDIFGRRPLLLLATLFFLTGAIIASLAKNFTHMLVGRSIQGVGGGGLIALSEVIITDLVPLNLRGKYFGFLSAMWSVGSVTGPILGGGFSQSATWRWIFYINYPFIGFGVLLILFFLNLNNRAISFKQRLRKIDYIGTGIFVASMTAFLIPLTWGGIMYNWDSYHTLVPLTIGAAGLLAFAFYEHCVATDPIIPLTIFQNTTATISFIGSALQGLVLWCLLYYLPLYYEAVKDYSPVLSGVALFPETFTVAPSALVVGCLTTITGRYRWALWLGWAGTTIGMGILCIVNVQTSTPGWIFLNIVPGIGLGMLFPSLGYAIQASATSENLAIAVGMFSFFRAFGQTMGVAVGGVVFQNQMHKNLLKHPGLVLKADAYSHDAARLVEIMKSMPDGAIKSQIQEAYTDSLRVVWEVCCAISGVAFILSGWTKGYDLNRALDTDQRLQ